MSLSASLVTRHHTCSAIATRLATSAPSLRGGGGGGLQETNLEPSVGEDASVATSPVMAGASQPLVPAAAGSDARKRNVAMAGLDSSPGSVEDMDDADAREEKKRQPVKRACNECRQQKVSPDPLHRCPSFGLRGLTDISPAL